MRRLALGVFFGVAALIVGLSVSLYLWQPAPLDIEINGIYLAEPRPVNQVTLIDDQAEPFVIDDFKNHWSVLFFGYTFCPDICPTTLAELNQVDRYLTDQQQGEGLVYYMVSVDPNRDTPERLKQYTGYFNPEFRGLTGTAEALDEFAKPLGIYYSVPEDPEDPENYPVDHSGALVVLNPDGELQAVFTPPFDTKTLADDLVAVRQQYAKTH